MKKIVLPVFVFAGLSGFAQQVKLESGKKIGITTTVSMDMDMGIGGQINMQSTYVSLLSVTGVAGDSYKADNTITRIKMSETGAGQDMDYDSDNKADTTSEIGKAFAGTLNDTAHILINKTTGIAADANPEKPEADHDNPLSGIMDNTKSPAAAASGAFFVIPAGKKPGDKWTDSITDNGLKVVRNFQLQGIENGVATTLLHAITTGTLNKKANDTEVDITLAGTSESTMTSDIVTSLMKKNVTTANMSGTMSVMGQSVPLTMKMNTEATFE